MPGKLRSESDVATHYVRHIAKEREVPAASNGSNIIGCGLNMPQHQYKTESRVKGYFNVDVLKGVQQFYLCDLASDRRYKALLSNV